MVTVSRPAGDCGHARAKRKRGRNDRVPSLAFRFAHAPPRAMIGGPRIIERGVRRLPFRFSRSGLPLDWLSGIGLRALNARLSGRTRAPCGFGRLVTGSVEQTHDLAGVRAAGKEPHLSVHQCGQKPTVL